MGLDNAIMLKVNILNKNIKVPNKLYDVINKKITIKKI
jgi:hypothetical protein